MDISDLENLNRLGLILNFAAGFLLAPELIGHQRIQRWEDRIERLGGMLNTVLGSETDDSPRARRLGGVASILLMCLVVYLVYGWLFWSEASDEFNAFLIVSLVGLATAISLKGRAMVDRGMPDMTSPSLFRVAWSQIVFAAVINSLTLYELGAVACLTMAALGYICLLGLFLVVKPSPSTQPTQSGPILTLLLIPVAIVFWPMLVGILALSPLFVAAILCGRFLLYVMDPERYRLRGRLVTIGIGAFILGNALQFVATY